jgi:beta-glucosidase
VNPSVEWPQKELKAFSRIMLNPGGSKLVTLVIAVKNLMYWNNERHAWDDDLCNIELLVGSSAGDIKLKKQITLK